MNDIFDVTVNNIELEESYHLKGNCAIKNGKVQAFKLKSNSCSFTGFGGAVMNKLSKIGVLNVEIKYAPEIIRQIEKQVIEGLY